MSDPFKPATSYPAVVGQLLAKARKDKNLEQKDVADHLGVSQSTWSRIEKGEIALTIEQLKLACGCLGLEPGFVMGQADAATHKLQDKGVHVAATRNDSASSAVGVGLALLAAAALGAMIAAMLSDDEA